MKSVSMAISGVLDFWSGSFENKWGLKVFFVQIGMKMLSYEDAVLILGPNYVFSAPNAVNFSMWFLQLIACIFEMPAVAIVMRLSQVCR